MIATPGYPVPMVDGWPWVPAMPPDPPVVTRVPLPTLNQVREWCQVGTVVSDELLQAVLNAEVELQAAGLAIPLLTDYPDTMPSSLAQALYRRVARELAARGVPLGMTGADEYGPVVLPAYDSEIQRLESPWRDIAIG